MKLFIVTVIACHLFIGCSGQENTSEDMADNTPVTSAEMEEDVVNIGSVVVTGVTTSGNENRYRFNVTLTSPDTGCDQYANWWEVISEDGSTLIYRRILGHSHVNEQPFTRSGGDVVIKNNEVVIIRGHMNNLGYGTTVYKGSVSEGFQPLTLEQDFASNLSTVAPLPTNCAF